MDKYKTKSTINKWFSAIKLKNLSKKAQVHITAFNRYQKKITFEHALKLFLFAINEQKESLRAIDTSFVSPKFQAEMALESVSYSQLSRILATLETDVLIDIFGQLLHQVHGKQVRNKRNHHYLIDSTTFSLNKTLFDWATFRQTKSGVKLHLKLCFMNKEHSHPEQFTITTANEHDVNQLDVLVNQPEATYVFDRGYLDFEKLDRLQEEGYFFVTRIKKNTCVHVWEDFETEEDFLISDQMVTLGKQAYHTHRFRLVTIKDELNREFQFLTNRIDLPGSEIADMYKSRWQIELFFKHIKQHMTSKKYFSTSETGVKNQIVLTLIAHLLTYLIKIETKTSKSIFQIKRLFSQLHFESAEKWLKLLKPPPT